MASETKLEYAKEFWTTANVVTGFSIIQMITYLFALGAGDKRIREGVFQARLFVLSEIVLATVLYCLAAAVLGKWQISIIRQQELSELSKRLYFVSLSRMVIIAITGVIGPVVTILVEK
jgi:hypothetical protein